MTTQHAEQSERDELTKELLDMAGDCQHNGAIRKAAFYLRVAALLAADKTGGEPFAWWAVDRDRVVIELCLPDGDDDRVYLDWKPLYTHPQPQQVPLLFSQRRAIAEKLGVPHDALFVGIVAAVEAALGIGGPKE